MFIFHRSTFVVCLRFIGMYTSLANGFNKIAIQATAQMAADKEAVGLSRVHIYEYRPKCILPLRDTCLSCF